MLRISVRVLFFCLIVNHGVSEADALDGEDNDISHPKKKAFYYQGQLIGLTRDRSLEDSTLPEPFENKLKNPFNEVYNDFANQNFLAKYQNFSTSIVQADEGNERNVKKCNISSDGDELVLSPDSKFNMTFDQMIPEFFKSMAGKNAFMTVADTNVSDTDTKQLITALDILKNILTSNDSKPFALRGGQAGDWKGQLGSDVDLIKAISKSFSLNGCKLSSSKVKEISDKDIEHQFQGILNFVKAAFPTERYTTENGSVKVLVGKWDLNKNKSTSDPKTSLESTENDAVQESVTNPSARGSLDALSGSSKTSHKGRDRTTSKVTAHVCSKCSKKWGLALSELENSWEACTCSEVTTPLQSTTTDTAWTTRTNPYLEFIKILETFSLTTELDETVSSLSPSSKTNYNIFISDNATENAIISKTTSGSPTTEEDLDTALKYENVSHTNASFSTVRSVATPYERKLPFYPLALLPNTLPTDKKFYKAYSPKTLRLTTATVVSDVTVPINDIGDTVSPTKSKAHEDLVKVFDPIVTSEMWSSVERSPATSPTILEPSDKSSTPAAEVYTSTEAVVPLTTTSREEISETSKLTTESVATSTEDRPNESSDGKNAFKIPQHILIKITYDQTTKLTEAGDTLTGDSEVFPAQMKTQLELNSSHKTESTLSTRSPLETNDSGEQSTSPDVMQETGNASTLTLSDLIKLTTKTLPMMDPFSEHISPSFKVPNENNYLRDGKHSTTSSSRARTGSTAKASTGLSHSTRRSKESSAKEPGTCTEKTTTPCKEVSSTTTVSCDTSPRPTTTTQTCKVTTTTKCPTETTATTCSLPEVTKKTDRVSEPIRTTTQAEYLDISTTLDLPLNCTVGVPNETPMTSGKTKGVLESFFTTKSISPKSRTEARGPESSTPKLDSTSPHGKTTTESTSDTKPVATTTEKIQMIPKEPSSTTPCSTTAGSKTSSLPSSTTCDVVQSLPTATVASTTTRMTTHPTVTTTCKMDILPPSTIPASTKPYNESKPETTPRLTTAKWPIDIGLPSKAPVNVGVTTEKPNPSTERHTPSTGKARNEKPIGHSTIFSPTDCSTKKYNNDTLASFPLPVSKPFDKLKTTVVLQRSTETNVETTTVDTLCPTTGKDLTPTTTCQSVQPPTETSKNSAPTETSKNSAPTETSKNLAPTETSKNTPTTTEPCTTAKQEGTTTKQEGTITKQEGTITKQEETTTKQEGTTTKQEETTTKQEGTTTKQEGTTTKQEGTTTKTTSCPVQEKTTKESAVTSSSNNPTTPPDCETKVIIEQCISTQKPNMKQLAKAAEQVDSPINTVTEPTKTPNNIRTNESPEGKMLKFAGGPSAFDFYGLLPYNSSVAVRHYVSDISDKAATVNNKNMIAQWNHETNITHKNYKIAMVSTLELIHYQRIQNQFLDTLRDVQIYDPMLEREIKLLYLPGMSILPDIKIAVFEEMLYAMDTIYSSASVIAWNNPHLRYHLPEVKKAMSVSNIPEELSYYWSEWRNVTGRKLRRLYEQYVELMNVTAISNGFCDASEMWTRDYETEDFMQLMGCHWEEIRPLYLELHAYVRCNLHKHYGDVTMSNDYSLPIPAHLVGDLWGFPSLPEAFWKNSILTKQRTDMSCEPTAWDMCDGKDFRIKMCSNGTLRDFFDLHHELTHVEYFIQYKDLSFPFRSGPNPGFHEALAGTILLSVENPSHLAQVGLAPKQKNHNAEVDINYLLRVALDKVAFLPYSYIVDLWRYKVFKGDIKANDYNRRWWDLRLQYQGLAPPNRRSEEDFDPGSKFHVAGNKPYIQNFLSTILQFQFHEALCRRAGLVSQKTPLHNCDISSSHEAGAIIRRVMSMGATQHWRVAMNELTGTRQISSKGLVEFFKPLFVWLKKENMRNGQKVGWKNTVNMF